MAFYIQQARGCCYECRSEVMVMIKKIIGLIAFLILTVQGANAYDPAAEVDSNWESTYSEELTDQAVHNTTLVEVEKSNTDSTYKQTWEENRKGKVLEETKYFKDVVRGFCETPDDYVCPPLLDDKAAEGFRTRLNSVDLTTGRISCSVLAPIPLYAPLTKETETVIFSKTFVNQACVKKYSTARNIDTSDSVKELKQENELFLEELKQQEFKYVVDYKKSGDDEFLDLADTLDALVSFNPEKFNLEETLLTRDLKTRAGYTVLPNDTVIEKINDTFKSFSEIWEGSGWDSSRFLNEIETQARIRDASASVANSSYFMLLDFWLKAGDIINDIALALAFLIVFYNTTATWAMPALTAKISGLQHHRENSLHRGISGAFIIILLFTTEIQKLNIQYESKTDGIVKSELIIQQSNLQSLIQMLYSETNRIADAFAEVGIRAYLNSMNASTGLFDGAQIDALATERMILTQEQEKIKQIESEMCYANYDVKSITDTLKKYRTGTLEELEKNPDFISSLGANPFPKSEREAQAMSSKTISPYNPIGSYDSGVVKKDAMPKFRAANYSPMSLSGCYANKKKMIENDSRLREIEEQLETAKSVAQKQAKVEYLKVINEIQWSLFAKTGYLSISFLPATAMLIENIGIIGDLEKTSRAIDDAVAAKDEGALNEIATSSIKSIAEDVPFLAILGGYQLAKLIHPIKEDLISGAIDKIGNVSAVATLGTSVIVSRAIKIAHKVSQKLKFDNDQIDVLDLQIAAMIIKSIFKSLIITTLTVGSLMLFLLLFIEKLFAFVASIFLIIFAFSKNQEERITAALGKIFVVGFKTVLIVVCVFLGMYSLGLVSTFEMLFIENYFNSMDMIENASWAYKISEFDVSNIMTLISLFFQKYIFYGVAKFSFMMLKLVMAVSIMWKMPNYVIELVYERISSVSDGVGDTLQAATQQHTARV